MRSLVLSRHGETQWNRIGRLQGRLDSPLTARGVAQADSLAMLAKSLGVRRIVASPLGRALATAQRVAEHCAAEIETADALVELSFGDCEGLTRDEYVARYPTLEADRAAARWTTPWPGGESYADAERRLAEWLRAEGTPWDAPPVLFVAHQSVCRALVRVLTGCSEAEALEHALASGGALQVWEGGRRVPLVPLASPHPHA